MTKPTDLEDPRKTIRRLLVDNWNPSNTPSVGTPSFATEQRSETDKDRPLVTVTNREDVAQSAAGYTSVRGDGSGVNARTMGFVVVNCWAERRLMEDTDQENPKTQAEEMWNEVARIVLANFAGTGALEYLRTDGPTSDEERTDTIESHRLFGRVEYSYELTPV